MPNPDAAAALHNFPPVVYVPCELPDPSSGAVDQTNLQIYMRRTRDGRVALLAYSALDRFRQLAGHDSDWALLTHEGLDELFAQQPFDLLLMDVEVPEDARKDCQWLTI